MTSPAGGTLRRWTFRFLLLLSLVGALLAYGGPLLYQLKGQTLLVLTSGSMAPTYPAGSAVVAKPVTPDQLRVGQVITFKPPPDDEGDTESTYVTHKIIGLKTLTATDEEGNPEVDPSGRVIKEHYVQTKGDGNEDPDPNLTPVAQVRFLVVDGYPGVGSWMIWSRTLTGKLILFAPPFVLLMLAELWSWRPRKRESTESPDEPVHPLQRYDDVHATV